MAVATFVSQVKESEKNSSIFTRVNINVIDQDMCKADVAVWGEHFGDCRAETNTVLVFENFKVSSSNGRPSFCSINQSRIYAGVFPSSQRLTSLMKVCEKVRSEAAERKKTYLGTATATKELSLADLEEESMILLEESNYKQRLAFTVKATITNFGNQLYYNSCPNKGCLKKVEEAHEEEGFFKCSRCGLIESHLKPIPKFMGQIKLLDESKSLYMTFNSESVGRTIFDCSVDYLKILVDSAGTKETSLLLKEHLSSRLNIQYRVGVCAKLNEYQFQKSVKYFISSIDEISALDQMAMNDEHSNMSASSVRDSLLAKRDPITE